MLIFLRSLQLVLYVAGWALVGQGLLYVLAGPGRERNAFYRLLRAVARPVPWLVRRITPQQVPDRRVPLLSFVLVCGAYVAVTATLIGWCASQGAGACR